MSAAVCGSKRSYFFDDMQPSSPPSSKKLRCGSSSPSPVRPSAPRSAVIDHLKSHFPRTDPEVLDRVVEECGHDLDSGLKILRELSMRSLDESVMGDPQREADATSALESVDCTPLCSASIEGAAWVEMFVTELMGVTTIDDAKSRVSTLLESFEMSLSSRNAGVTEATLDGVQKENLMLKEQVQAILQENNVLKRAVAIQYERQKGFEEKDREVVHLKEILSQYQEQVRTLEVNNYALSMHLRQSQQTNSIIGRFNPDVF